MLALFPDFPALEQECAYAGRAWYLFSQEHDTIEEGPEFLQQKGNFLHVVQLTIHSTFGMYDIHPPTFLEPHFQAPPFQNTNTEVVQAGRAWYFFSREHRQG